MKSFYFILLAVFMNSCIGAEPVSSNPVIRTFTPPYKNVYDNVCDLNYSNEPLWEIGLNFKEQYGVMLAIPEETMDLFIKPKGDKEEIFQYLISLFGQYPFKFVQKDQPDGLWVGLAADQDVLAKIMDLIKMRFQIEESKKGNGIRINLKDEQVPCWEAIGQIAQKSQLGIDYITLPELVRNNREVLAYQKVSPFYLYISKEVTTGKMVLDLLYSPKVTTDVWDIKIKNVCLYKGDTKKQEVPGCTLTATDKSSQCNEHVQWISDGPVQWEEGLTIQGVIQGPILTHEYLVENLNKNVSVKGDGLEINVNATSLNPQSEHQQGIYLEPNEIEGDWITVTISILGDLDVAEKSFMHKIDQKRKEGNQPTQEEMSRYENLLKEKMAVIKVESLGKPESSNAPDFPKYGGIYYHNTVTGIDETQVMFDSIQDGKEIFPLNLELRKYKPQEIEFSKLISSLGN